MNNDKPRSSSETTSLLDRIRHHFSRVPHDEESLIELVRTAEENNVVEPDALAMIEGALHVCNMRVRDIIIPRVQMVTVDYNSEPEEILKIVVESGHSRFPVISGHKDEVAGILLAKDLLAYFASKDKGTEFDIKDVMRPAVFVPESKRLNVLLREFRINRNHMAMVVDEYCGTSGLVTIEDVIEEIVGEIEDEHDIEEEDLIIKHGHNRYTVKALTPIEEFNEYFHTDLSDEEFDTVGGLVMNSFGHVPKRGEAMELANFNIKVLRSDKRRIQLMRFVKMETPAPITEDTN